MSTEIITIKEAKANLKGAIKATVVKVGDLNAGSKNGKDWTNRKFTLDDGSEIIDITCWNDDTKKFQLGVTYQIVNAWWKEYQGKPQLDLGRYAQVTIVGSDKVPEQTKIETPGVKQIPTPTSAEPKTPEPESDEMGPDWDGKPIRSKVAGLESHENCWAVAVQEAMKTYPSQNDKHSMMILAQVFYKKLMEFEIHVKN